MTDAMTRHSDAELLAAFVDGQLDQQQLQVVTAHLASCEECRSVIGEAAAFEQEVQTQVKPKRALMAIAAAVVVAILAVPVVRLYMHQQEISSDVKEVRAAQEKERVIEARFSEQDIYAPHRTMRGPSEQENDRLQAAAFELIADTEKDTSPAALRARAFGQVASTDTKGAHDTRGALNTLNRIPQEARDAATWNDFAAVYSARGEYDDALKAVEQALRLQPKMPEALFNKAVILRSLGKIDDADGAWKEYLAVDSQSPWAKEARETRQRMKSLQ